MAFKISDFTENMQYGGARPHLFDVGMSLPPALISNFASSFEKDLPIKATATQIPASTVEAIPVFYQGRMVNFSGNRVYAPWTIEVINDEDFGVYDAYVAWLSALNDPELNARGSGFDSSPAKYKGQASIFQYGQDQTLIKRWTCQGLFPTNVSEITLAWQDTNQIQRFQVTFAVDAVIPDVTTRR